MIRLGVNIDHVATLRQQRGEDYPSVVEAARTSLAAGADQITIHLREDRRHIQDMDVPAVQMVTKEFSRLLNLEMGCNEGILDVAMQVRPDWVCLVPEKREEKTTEGGLDLLSAENFEKVHHTCRVLKSNGTKIKVSLFLEACPKTLERARLLKAAALIDAVEIHTGEYARAVLNEDDLEAFFQRFLQAKNFLMEHQISCHAGHGLTLESTRPLLERRLFIEYNIGHWIISKALFSGLSTVVARFKEEFAKWESF
ncbi:MAG: pyridoxine 5'-phosphate synthase [Oligoflexia bacterium]|nr:pyridoxine 5'-phosphate synthase [Oligoflexia bacterium]MBF0367363.1 pyridoxine 5'-phosphate synthase [Oligoflexia bacterium]